MRLLLCAILVLFPAYAVSAAAPSGDPPEQTKKKICKVDPEDTESRVRRRICKTEAEWNGETEKKSDADQTPKQGQ